jgi:hypothetical protein
MPDLASRGTGPGRGRPARGYTWPPFDKGNDAASTHGAYSSELRLSEDPRVAQTVEEIRSTQPIWHPADEGALWRLALAYRRLELSARALDAVDRELADAPLAAYRDGADFLHRLREDHARWLREASRIEAELARTPASRAKLGLHVALGRRALSVVELHEQAELDESEASG